MLTFNEVFDHYCLRSPAKKSEEHKPAQVREKYTEIIATVGVDPSLLKQYRDPLTGKKHIPKGENTPYFIPNEDEAFVIDLLMNHTSADFKELRRANYRNVSLPVRASLIDGFTRMLAHLGHGPIIVEKQREAMDRRLHYGIDKAMSQFVEELDSFRKYMAEIADAPSAGILYEDGIALIQEAASQVKKSRDEFQQLVDCFRDIRFNELSDLAGEDASTMEPDVLTRMHEESAVNTALMDNPEYLALLDQRYALLEENTFIKSQMSQWKKITDQMQKVRQRIAMEVLGHPLPPRPKRVDIRIPPQTVLAEAIDDLRSIQEVSPPMGYLTDQEKARCREIIRQSGCGNNPFMDTDDEEE